MSSAKMLSPVMLQFLFFSNLNNGDPRFFSGVCCRCNNSERNLLTVELELVKFSWGNKGIVGGDFNMILKSSGRSGSAYNDLGIEEFH